MLKKDKHTLPWKDFSKRWQKYSTPPARPSEQAIKVYKDFIEVASNYFKENIKVLILGATPELRDLVQEFTNDVTIVDINQKMVKSMSELVKKKNKHESIIKSNWLNMPVSDNLFHIILGDIVMQNIEFNKQQLFLEEIQRILTPNGYFIHKLELIPNNWNNKTIEETFKLYKDFKPTKQLAMELCIDLIISLFDKKNHLISSKEVFRKLKKYFRNSTFNYPDQNINIMLNWIWEMWQPMEKVWSTDYEKNVTKQVSKCFKILDKKVLSDCKYRNIDESFPIWFCRVKKIN